MCFLLTKHKQYFWLFKISTVNKKLRVQRVGGRNNLRKYILQGGYKHKQISFYQLWICTSFIVSNNGTGMWNLSSFTIFNSSGSTCLLSEAQQSSLECTDIIW